ncbi:secretory lipase [Nocardia tenerifensis]|uniref:Secretory lipase n=1 Tax=Nocardia tenerifensis TaxID=228006 RepID=A0A318K060_9NOCA|nr:lipase family protein [Nocardia tenerifensis]PXX64332.1 secretory lipase [Nocardia tenerifensis]
MVSEYPPLPEADPFYAPPPGLGQVPPGTVLRAREVEIALFGAVPQRVSAWQLLYRTCDLDQAPEAAVTTVLLPWGADPTRERPLVSFQCAIDAVASKCLPSYALRRGARAAGSIPPLELPLIVSALARGWAVSVPDHGGTAGRFGVAREPGYRALDAIRAGLAFAPLGLSSTTRVALWGYSGGGLATAWAAELAPEYAPELDLVGAVAASPVGDPAAAFVRLNGSLFAGFAAVFTAGLRRAYPDLDLLLRTHLDARYLGWLAQAETTATFPLLYRFARRDIDQHCRGGLAALLDAPELQRVLGDIEPGRRVPAMPMLVVQGVYDEVIAVADVDAHVARYAEGGAHVRYLRDRLSTHLLLQYFALPVMIDWIDDRLARRDPGPVGTETLWSLAFSRRALAGHLDFARVLVRMLFARPIRATRRPAETPSPVFGSRAAHVAR